MQDSQFHLGERRVVITGGGGNIGGTAALALARAGALVAIVDIDRDAVDRRVAAVEEVGGVALPLVYDATDPAQVEELTGRVVEAWGGIDVGLNCVGISNGKNDEHTTLEEFRHEIEVNLTSMWCNAMAQMKVMRASPSGGSIILIGSIAATSAMWSGSYSASKAGVVQLAASLAFQWGRYGIRVNVVSPGYVVRDNGNGANRSAAAVALLRQTTYVGRTLTAEDIAGPIVFLASDASGFMTGRNYIVDGGHTMSSWHTGPDLETFIPTMPSSDC